MEKKFTTFKVDIGGMRGSTGFLDVYDHEEIPAEVDLCGTMYRLKHQIYGPECYSFEMHTWRPLRPTNMFFVYALWKDERCLYVGATRFPKKRFAQHLYNFGEGVEMRILHTGNFKKIKALETREIAAYTRKYPWLANISRNSGISIRSASRIFSLHTVTLTEPLPNLEEFQEMLQFASKPGDIIRQSDRSIYVRQRARDKAEYDKWVYDPTRDPANY